MGPSPVMLKLLIITTTYGRLGLGSTRRFFRVRNGIAFESSIALIHIQTTGTDLAAASNNKTQLTRQTRVLSELQKTGDTLARPVAAAAVGHLHRALLVQLALVAQQLCYVRVCVCLCQDKKRSLKLSWRNVGGLDRSVRRVWCWRSRKTRSRISI